jgi:hypothetical protein
MELISSEFRENKNISRSPNLHQTDETLCSIQHIKILISSFWSIDVLRVFRISFTSCIRNSFKVQGYYKWFIRFQNASVLKTNESFIVTMFTQLLISTDTIGLTIVPDRGATCSGDVLTNWRMHLVSTFNCHVNLK